MSIQKKTATANENPAVQTQTDLPYRIRVGVTGHRSLADVDSLARSVEDILTKKIFELFDRPVSPAVDVTPPIAYTLLTSLAEGADRLLATEIVKLPDAEIEAVLPLAPEEYIQDFSTAESKAEFHMWLNKARKTVRPEVGGRDTGQPEGRKRAYEAVGRFVVDHCDVLIAIWDGLQASGRGGTEEIVAYARARNCPLITIPTNQPKEIQIEKGNGLSNRALSRIAYFNRYAIPPATLESSVVNMDRRLFQNPEGQRIPALLRLRVREGLLPWYVRASRIAKQNQQRYYRAGLVVYALSPLAVGAVALGILAPGWSLGAFLAEFLFLVAIYSIIRIADRRKVHKKWIEARFLTERLRAAIFLFSCGTEPGSLGLPPLMRTALRDDEWILRLFDEIMRRAGPPPSCPEIAVRSCTDFVRSRLINDQIAFHAAEAMETGKIGDRLERAGRATFLAAIFAAVWHPISQLLGFRGLLLLLEKPVVFLAVVLPAAGAAIGGRRTHREYSRLEKRSRFMEIALAELDKRYEDVGDGTEMEALLHETEQLLLQESQDWLMLMKSVKMEAI